MLVSEVGVSADAPNISTEPTKGGDLCFSTSSLAFSLSSCVNFLHFMYFLCPQQKGSWQDVPAGVMVGVSSTLFILGSVWQEEICLIYTKQFAMPFCHLEGEVLRLFKYLSSNAQISLQKMGVWRSVPARKLGWTESGYICHGIEAGWAPRKRNKKSKRKAQKPSAGPAKTSPPPWD